MSGQCVFQYHRESDDVVPPTRHSAEAAGFDVATTEDVFIPRGERVRISTGLRVAVSPGYYIRIAPRSGLAVKQGLDVLAGVVDSDYRGIVEVCLINLGETPCLIKKGERMAQFIIEKIATPDAKECLDVNLLGRTERGDGGFGSTGV